jgi:hypothetical protein
MFLNRRSRGIAALVVTVLLLAALPAAAGVASPEMRTARRVESFWDGFLARALAWLGGPWGGAPATTSSSGDSGSQIDPLG